MPTKLIEGKDYYIEKGKQVFTSEYLKARGYCCKTACKHCPYGYVRPRSILKPKKND